MEKILRNVRVKGQDCIGCQRHLKEIMLSVMFEDDSEDPANVHDFFLTQKQAESMLNELSTVISQNRDSEQEESVWTGRAVNSQTLQKSLDNLNGKVKD